MGRQLPHWPHSTVCLPPTPSGGGLCNSQREQQHSQPRARHVTSASGTQSKMAVMPEPEPRIIIWTDHALAKAQFLGISRADVEDTILNGHGRRTETLRCRLARDGWALGDRLQSSGGRGRPDGDRRDPLATELAFDAMKIDGHYDQRADIAWLRFEDYDASTVVAEETGFGLRELDPADRHVIGLEYWQASRTLPTDLLRMLPAPPVGVAP
jgi:uncharacterized protein YuzE